MLDVASHLGGHLITPKTRSKNGHLDPKKRYGREKLFGREKAGKAVKKCAFGREKTALGREKA